MSEAQKMKELMEKNAADKNMRDKQAAQIEAELIEQFRLTVGPQKAGETLYKIRTDIKKIADGAKEDGILQYTYKYLLDDRQPTKDDLAAGPSTPPDKRSRAGKEWSLVNRDGSLSKFGEEVREGLTKLGYEVRYSHPTFTICWGNPTSV